MRKSKTRSPAQKRGENDSVADNIVHPERPWYESASPGPTSGGRGKFGGTTTRPSPAASGSVPRTESTAGSESARARRRSAGPATKRKVQAKVVRKASGGVLRPTDASIQRSRRARGP